ncbi:ammonium transporter [Halosquirtibacter xylanolyticus]|uniref:ammonium transporter n=1 Tax=Halosquirtibacter xylanolyticus TaxID=3374599 RepID=UPI003749FCB8|nr:ammonium transporter [Prolixibacteraceae bacterium]
MLYTILNTSPSTFDSLDTVWILICACLVMFMQAGFALVEVGFTRSKNAVNILMKNMMDFSIGSVAFWLIGYGIMFGPSISGLIGTIDIGFQNHYGLEIPDNAFLFFQTVFCATAATIVSGAVAERAKFTTYLIFSLFIGIVIYPVSGHWIWGGGWLSELGFHDFAGSTVVHSVGAWLGIVGAKMLGPRLGKYNGKAKAIPGHNLVFGTLGVFILWFGWFGFNPGSQLAAQGLENANAISHIFITTNLSAASGAIAAMCLSWKRYKFPSLSMTLNGALGGLVAITAGCDVISPRDAIFVGILAGVTLIFAVEIIDQKLRIDDPVGAISVHGVCGVLGTLLVGILDPQEGLLYTGDTTLLLTQLVGVAAVAAWALSLGWVMFYTLKRTIGLRVTKREEEEGLDIYEHGESVYN